MLILKKYFMSKKHLYHLIIIYFSTQITLGGCTYSIKYKLTPQNVVHAKTSHKLNVVVSIFSDLRPPEECSSSIRKKIYSENVNDYTYNNGFKGKVNEEISKMIASHLEYSKVFSKITYSNITQDQITEDYLIKLKNSGIDALLIGDVLNFYGYYDKDAGQFFYPLLIGCAFALPPLLFMDHYKEKTYFIGEEITVTEYDPLPVYLSIIGLTVGSLVGAQIDANRERDIEWHTRLHYKLINVSTNQVLLESTIDSHAKEHKAIPNLKKSNKFWVVVNSLCSTVNQMAKELYKGLSF